MQTVPTQASSGQPVERNSDAAHPGRARVRALVLNILGTRAPARAFSDDETLAEIGIASIDMVTLLLALESAFDIEVPQFEITADVFRSIATIEALLLRLGALRVDA